MNLKINRIVKELNDYSGIGIISGRPEISAYTSIR